MKCFFCERGIATGDSLRRINAKGQPGVWACNEHFRQTDVPRDPEIDRIISAVERGTPP